MGSHWNFPPLSVIRLVQLCSVILVSRCHADFYVFYRQNFADCRCVFYPKTAANQRNCAQLFKLTEYSHDFRFIVFNWRKQAIWWGKWVTGFNGFVHSCGLSVVCWILAQRLSLIPSYLHFIYVSCSSYLFCRFVDLHCGSSGHSWMVNSWYRCAKSFILAICKGRCLWCIDQSKIWVYLYLCLCIYLCMYLLICVLCRQF